MVSVLFTWPKGEVDKSSCLLASTQLPGAPQTVSFCWPLHISSFLFLASLPKFSVRNLLSSFFPVTLFLSPVPLSPSSSTFRTKVVFPCPLSNLTYEKRLAVWLRVGPLSFPRSILAFQGDQCGCHWAQISDGAKFLLKMLACESHVHINTETVSASYRSLEKKSCLIGQLASKIPLGNPPSRLFLFYKIVSRGVYNLPSEVSGIYHTTHFNSKITPNKLLLEA